MPLYNSTTALLPQRSFTAASPTMRDLYIALYEYKMLCNISPMLYHEVMFNCTIQTTPIVQRLCYHSKPLCYSRSHTQRTKTMPELMLK